MPIMTEVKLVVLALSAASIFGAGFGLSHKIDEAKIQRMEFGILMANNEAKSLLQLASERAETATANAKKLNSELDEAHEAFIKTAVDYDQQLDSIRLYADRRPCGSGAATASNSTGISQEAAREAELDSEIDRTIKEAAVVADIAADYAHNAYTFANVNNCGILRE